MEAGALMDYMPKSARLVTPGYMPKSARAVEPEVPIEESALRGGAQGLTAKFGDEITGAIQAAPRWARAVSPLGFLLDPLQQLADATSGVPEAQRAAAKEIDAEKAARPDAPGFFPRYRAARDAERAANERAKAAHSTAYGAGEIAGMVLGSPVPGGGGLARSMATGAGLGAVTGLGGSESDLTKGEVGGALADTAVGGAAGAAGGALGYGAGKVLGKAVEKASAGIRKAQADAAQKAAAAALATERSARGALGGEANAVLHAIGEWEKAALNAGGMYSPKIVAAAKAKLADPAVQALKANAMENSLAQGTDRMATSLGTAQNVFQTARQGNTPQQIEKAAEEMLAKPIRNQLLPRLKTYVSRALPIAAASATGGGVPGMVLGTGLAATLGKPGTAAANFAKHPATRNALWRAVGGAAGAGKKAAEKSIPAAQRALTQDEVEALLDVLRGNDAP